MMSSLIATPLPQYKKNQRRRRRTKITSKTCQRSPLRREFEKNVIMKNIEERKKMERELGLYNLSEDIRNIDKPTSTFQERLDDIMGDDV